jgi:ribosomal protein L7/L12
MDTHEWLVALLGVGALVLALRAASSQRVAAPVVPVTDELIRSLVAQGSKIDAIKAYRQRHRCDLKEAKQAVDALAEALRAP